MSNIGLKYKETRELHTDKTYSNRKYKIADISSSCESLNLITVGYVSLSLPILLFIQLSKNIII